MTTTISVDESTKERFDDLRPEGAASADEFLGVLLDHYDDGDVGDLQPFGGEVPEGFKAWSGDEAPEWTREEIDEALDRIEEKVEEAASSAETAEERTGRLERLLEGLQG